MAVPSRQHRTGEHVAARLDCDRPGRMRRGAVEQEPDHSTPCSPGRAGPRASRERPQTASVAAPNRTTGDLHHGVLRPLHRAQQIQRRTAPAPTAPLTSASPACACTQNESVAARPAAVQDVRGAQVAPRAPPRDGSASTGTSGFQGRKRRRCSRQSSGTSATARQTARRGEQRPATRSVAPSHARFIASAVHLIAISLRRTRRRARARSGTAAARDGSTRSASSSRPGALRVPPAARRATSSRYPRPGRSRARSVTLRTPTIPPPRSASASSQPSGRMEERRHAGARLLRGIGWRRLGPAAASTLAASGTSATGIAAGCGSMRRVTPGIRSVSPRSARNSPHSQNGSTPTQAPVASQETTANAVGVTRNAARMLRKNNPSASAVTAPVTHSA